MENGLTIAWRRVSEKEADYAMQIIEKENTCIQYAYNHMEGNRYVLHSIHYFRKDHRHLSI